MDIVCCVMLAPQHRAVSADHLGNVRATVSDMLIPRGSGVFDADLRTLTDYYPFGMTMPGRTLSSADYRYGYNTQERVDEIAGEGNHYTAEYWEYDPRAARRWNLDPRPVVGLTPSGTFQSNPIVAADIFGDSIRVEQTSGFLFWHTTDTYTYRNGGWFDGSGVKANPSEIGGLLSQVDAALNAEGQTPFGSLVLNSLQSSPYDFIFKRGSMSQFLITNPAAAYFLEYINKKENKDDYLREPYLFDHIPNGSGGLITIPVTTEALPEQGGRSVRRPGVAIFHELLHAWLASKGLSRQDVELVNGRNIQVEEFIVSRMENIIRIQMGLPLRTHYPVDSQGRGVGPSVIPDNIEAYR